MHTNENIWFIPRLALPAPIQPELILAPGFNVIASDGPIWINPELIGLSGGLLLPGDRITSIINHTKSSAGYCSFEPINWMAEYMGTFEIIINDEPCRHALFNALDLNGNPLKVSGIHRNAYVAFALFGPDLLFTTPAIASRVIICDEINFRGNYEVE